MKYYIKNNLIFSDETATIKIIDKIKDIEIPNTKNISNSFVSNRTLIKEIENILTNSGKNYKISKPINNIDKIIKDIKSKKKELKKITSNDYIFLERTSAVEIVDTILSSIKNSNINNIKLKIENYIKTIKTQEDNKYAQINESIEIEKNKISQTKEKKSQILETSKIKEIEKLENKKNEIDSKISQLKSYNTSHNKQDDYISNLKEKQEEINIKNQDYKFQIKLLKNNIKTLKIDLKLGKKKHFNWINGIFMILTLGLIYWTKFTDIKYFILMYQKKIVKYEEKITILENKNLKLKNQLSKIKDNKDSKQEKQEQENKINSLKNELDKINNNIKTYQEKVKKEDSKLNIYDKNITKIESKIIELESQKQEFNKYSYKKLEEILNKLIEYKKTQEENLEKIKQKIKTQNIDINGEFIFEM